MSLDNHYLSIVTTLVLLALGFIGFMGRSWINHVNKNLEGLQKEFAELRKDREVRWLIQTKDCGECRERLTWLEAKINGKKEQNHHE